MRQTDRVGGGWCGGSGLRAAPAHSPSPGAPPQASSFSSITDSTMSLNIITVTLNMGETSVGWGPLSRAGVPGRGGPCVLGSLGAGGSLCAGVPGRGSLDGVPAHLLPPVERHHFLGISIVGQSNDRGDGGIYIGSIMKGGAVAADGRIEPGDMLLQVRGCRELLGGPEVSTPTPPC